MRMPKTKPPHYWSYLLRLWGAGKGTDSTCRASLENPMTGERRGFASLKDLFAFLQAQVDNWRAVSTDDDVEQTGEK